VKLSLDDIADESAGSLMRARAVSDARGLTDVDEMVRYIVREYFAAGRFVRGETWREIAEEFGLTDTRARHLTSEAARVFRLNADNETVAEARAKITAELRDISDRAKTDQRPDYKAAVSAQAELADMHGLKQRAGAAVAVQVNVGEQADRDAVVGEAFARAMVAAGATPELVRRVLEVLPDMLAEAAESADPKAIMLR
jgi:hypothetical protein